MNKGPKESRKRNLLFTCVGCDQQMFRAGKKVNTLAKLCGKCDQKTNVEHTQKRTETVVETTIAPNNELTDVQKDNIRAVERNQNKLALVSVLLREHPEVDFHGLWTMAERKMNP